ncbi:MAG TPA: radical SAM protein [Humisphaera sp.]|nr:radical SAM protein [Humisphaera sp.]
MKMQTLGRLAVKHIRNTVAEEVYIKTGKDFTRPVSVYAIVNERCNYKCKYCEYWRLPNYVDEMTTEEWTNALVSLKEFIGPYHVEFSGGEPYIKKGFLDICKACHDNGINWGVTTNGSAFSERIINQTLDLKPFNINMSMDSHIAEIHNYARGIEGSLEKITKGIQMLIAERNRRGMDFPVIIKPVVHKLNYKYLPDMVDWVKQLGATAINMQPVDRWSTETQDELWIGEEDIPELEEVAQELLRRKRAGDPILNSELLLSSWAKHYREEKAPAEVMPCKVGMRNYFIRTNGDVEVCWYFPPIGNVKTQSARDIWYSELGTERRAETTACEKLCLYTCLSQKTVMDKAKMAVTLLTGNRGKNHSHKHEAVDQLQVKHDKNIHLPILTPVGGHKKEDHRIQTASLESLRAARAPKSTVV